MSYLLITLTCINQHPHIVEGVVNLELLHSRKIMAARDQESGPSKDSDSDVS